MYMEGLYCNLLYVHKEGGGGLPDYSKQGGDFKQIRLRKSIP